MEWAGRHDPRPRETGEHGRERRRRHRAHRRPRPTPTPPEEGDRDKHEMRTMTTSHRATPSQGKWRICDDFSGKRTCRKTTEAGTASGFAFSIEPSPRQEARRHHLFHGQPYLRHVPTSGAPMLRTLMRSTALTRQSSAVKPSRTTTTKVRPLEFQPHSSLMGEVREPCRSRSRFSNRSQSLEHIKVK